MRKHVYLRIERSNIALELGPISNHTVLMAATTKAFWRNFINYWSVPLRQRWADLAEQYQAAGKSWKRAEYDAFVEVMKYCQSNQSAHDTALINPDSPRFVGCITLTHDDEIRHYEDYDTSTCFVSSELLDHGRIHNSKCIIAHIEHDRLEKEAKEKKKQDDLKMLAERAGVEVPVVSREVKPESKPVAVVVTTKKASKAKKSKHDPSVKSMF
jgi:hypothetical protein